MESKRTTTLISFCTKSHFDVWKLTSECVPNFVTADRYIVYVPDDEVSLFQKITNPTVSVFPESALEIEYKNELKTAVAFSGNSKRFNWYFQQFLKIESLIATEADRLIIWDADCVPVKEMEFFGQSGKPKFILSSEYNYEYFDCIDRLLKIEKIKKLSYISPGFPFLKSWISEFVNYVEAVNPGKKWWEAIIAETNLSSKSGFSEFETLGTWAQHSHPNDFEILTCNWERFGQSRFNYARNINSTQLIEIGKSNNLDIISFENWDVRGIRRVMKIILRFVPNTYIKIKTKYT